MTNRFRYRNKSSLSEKAELELVFPYWMLNIFKALPHALNYYEVHDGGDIAEVPFQNHIK